MMDRIKTLGQEKERVLAEKDNTIAEKHREIAETRSEKDALTREKKKILSELEEAQSTIGSLRESHSIEVEALQIEITDIKADIEHLHLINAAKEREYKTDKQRLESDKKEIKQRYEKQLETIKKEKQAMEERYLSDGQALEQQHQAQLESKVSELSAKDALISSKSSTIQNLQVKLWQALGTASSKDNLSVFSPGVKLTFTKLASLPEAISFLGQSTAVGGDVYVGVTKDRKVFKYNITNLKDSWGTLPLAPVSRTGIGYLNKKVLTVGGRKSSNEVTADIHEFDEASQQWIKSTSIPPMPTARAVATASCQLVITTSSDRLWGE